MPERAGETRRELRLPEAAAPHPEEMRWALDLRIGERFSLQTSARATPAGIVAITLLVSAAAIPLVWLARQRMRG